MWRQYRDLYAGGEPIQSQRRSISGAAGEGNRVTFTGAIEPEFYENYIGPRLSTGTRRPCFAGNRA